MLSILRNRLFFAAASGHFAVDVLNSTGPVLLAVLAPSLGLRYADIGGAITLYTLVGSLSQPVFGWMSDRFNGKLALLGGIGTIWMAVCYGIVAVLNEWSLMLPFFVLAALGSGLFHPVGTASAASAGQARAGNAMATFFFSGQIGLALGPALGGVLFGFSGNFGMLPLCLAATLLAGFQLTAPRTPPLLNKVKRAAGSTARAAAAAIAAFVVLVAVRSSIQATYTAFLPKLFADRGWEPAAFGVLAGTFMFAAAIGNFVSGELADRQGMRLATVSALLLSIPAGLLCLWAPTPLTAFVGCAIAGLLVGGQHSVLVVHAQRLLPVRQGFAAGLILGFTFATGALGVWIGGISADQIGLYPTLQIITLLAVPCAILAMTLPGRERAVPVVASAKT